MGESRGARAWSEVTLSDTTWRTSGRAIQRTLFALAVVGVLAPAGRALAWGLVAQQGVMRGAIECLPKQIKPFYHTHRFELPSLSVEPTIPERGPERRFAVDRLMPFPFADL